MTLKHNGGLAFPRAMTVSHGACADHQEVVPPEDGMTLRDYFAAKAMQAIISGKKILIDEHWHDRVAIDAYAMADAMIVQRENLEKGDD